MGVNLLVVRCRVGEGSFREGAARRGAQGARIGLQLVRYVVVLLRRRDRADEGMVFGRGP